VWGGKLTTFRRLAEEAADAMCAALDERRPPWTAGALLPGGDLSDWIGPPRRPDEDFSHFVQAVKARHAWLPAALAPRLCRAYGSRIDRVIGGARGVEGLGREIAPGLHEAECQHLQREEWAVTAEDVLWRRSKLGLHLTPEQREAVARFLS
jgi:glycerol-3-phosphate dehydrogenase